MNQRLGVYEGFNTSHDSDNCEAVTACSLGSEWLVSASHSQPQDMESKNEFPAAIWRRSRQIAAGKGIFLIAILGLRERSLRLGSLTPGYMLTPLRG